MRLLRMGRRSKVARLRRGASNRSYFFGGLYQRDSQ